MIMKGQKRKLPPEDGESDGSCLTWENQRQFVFSVSMIKYQRGQELPEPSLRRSVLIANTLRQMETCSAPSVDWGVSPPACSSSFVLQVNEQESSFSGDAAEEHQSAFTVDNNHSVPPGSQLDSPDCPTSRCASDVFSSASSVPPPVQEEDDWESMSADSDLYLSTAISSILTALDSTIDGSLHEAPRSPFRSLENFSGSYEGGVSLVKQGVRGNGRYWEQQDEGSERETSMEVMTSSYLGDFTVEELFQDIDTSLMEKDMGILELRGSGAAYQHGDDLLRYLPSFSPTSSSAHPLSLSLNQNIKCLPSFASFSPSSFSSAPHSVSSPVFPGQSHMRDGLELDHLMEILVES